MSVGSCPSAAVCAGMAACAGFLMAVRGECSTGKPPCGIWQLQFLRSCLQEQASEVGMQVQKADVGCGSPGLGWHCWDQLVQRVIQHSLQQVS